MTDIATLKLPELPMYVKRGESFSHSLWVKEDDDEPRDLTGYTAKLQVRVAENSEVLLELASSSGITITPSTGKILIEITKVQTAALEFDIARYDLLVTSSAGISTYLVQGDFIIIPRYTQE